MPELLPGNSLGFLLTDIARLFRHAFEKAVMEAGTDLTAGEVRALTHVARCQGSRQAVIAERMGVEPMTLSAYLDRLEARGLIRRTPDARDRRAKVIHPTDAAERVFEKVRPVTLQVYDIVMEGIEPNERAVVEKALLRMRSNLSSETQGGGEGDGQQPAPPLIEGAA